MKLGCSLAQQILTLLSANHINCLTKLTVRGQPKVGIIRMRTPTDHYASELQAQHHIQSDDLLTVCRLAKVENIFDKIESFSFEQFFGFTCHLFITTESQHCREQLAAILPKFGSVAVFSLLKISYHLSDAENSLLREQQIAKLAMKSLQAMPVQTLVIGLAQIVEAEENGDHYRTCAMIAPALLQLTAHHGESILSLLSKKISASAWNQLQQQLLQELSTLRAQAPTHSSEHRIKVKVKDTERQFAEVAC